jgi:hypothetical protein
MLDEAAGLSRQISSLEDTFRNTMLDGSTILDGLNCPPKIAKCDTEAMQRKSDFLGTYLKEK